MGKHILEEASRCLQCKKPLCSEGCPVSTPANRVIEALLAGDMRKAGAMLFENNPLTAVCSLICPHENFCEGHCILGKKGAPVQVSDIEQYVSRYYLEQFQPERPVNGNNAKRIAIIGSGPAGITVAFILARQGFDITLFESKERIGGVLQYGIPDFRLPKVILEKLREKLIGLGVKIRPNILIGPVVGLDDLFRDDYKAVFIGTGVWNPRPLHLKGETLGNAHYAIHYLRNPDVYSLGRRVAVIGAGNVAMDVARTALRKGAEVTVLYRRGEGDISATRYEYEYAKMDGVRFRFHTAPVEITDKGVVVVDTQVVAGDDGRDRVEPVAGSESLFEADSVLIAVSQAPRNNLSGLEIGRTGLVITDEEGRTSRPGVFASGDVVTGAKTVAEAVSFSKRSARAIVEYVAGLED